MSTTAERNISLLETTTEDGYLAGHNAAGAAKKWDSKNFRLGRVADVRNLTSTSYTLLTSDEGKLLVYNSASNGVYTVPPDGTLDWPVGGGADLMRLGTGKLSVAAGSGVTLLHPSTGAGRFARLRYSVMRLRKIAANTYVVYGDTSAS